MGFICGLKWGAITMSLSVGAFAHVNGARWPWLLSCVAMWALAKLDDVYVITGCETAPRKK